VGLWRLCAARRGNLTGFTEIISAKRAEKTGWDIENSPIDLSSSPNLGSCVSVKIEPSFIWLIKKYGESSTKKE
jgi:hypothetical protein